MYIHTYRIVGLHSRAMVLLVLVHTLYSYDVVCTSTMYYVPVRGSSTITRCMYVYIGWSELESVETKQNAREVARSTRLVAGGKESNY